MDLPLLFEQILGPIEQCLVQLSFGVLGVLPPLRVEPHQPCGPGKVHFLMAKAGLGLHVSGLLQEHVLAGNTLRPAHPVAPAVIRNGGFRASSLQVSICLGPWDGY